MTKKMVNVRGKKVEVIKGDSGKLYHVRSFGVSTFEPVRRANGKKSTPEE